MTAAQQDNLADMVKNVEQITKDEKQEVKEISKNGSKKENKIEPVNVISLQDFFKKNQNFFTSSDIVRYVNISSVKGVDQDETLAFSVLESKPLKNSKTTKRVIYTFNDAKQRAVLDMTPDYMNVFRNGIVLVYKPNDSLVVRCYSVTSSMFIVYCAKMGEKIIPFDMQKLKRKEKSIPLDISSSEKVLGLLPETFNKPADKELIILKYKQFDKYKEEITNVGSAVDWFLNRQSSVADINHLMQIDNIIISILKYSN